MSAGPPPGERVIGFPGSLAMSHTVITRDGPFGPYETCSCDERHDIPQDEHLVHAVTNTLSTMLGKTMAQRFEEGRVPPSTAYAAGYAEARQDALDLLEFFLTGDMPETAHGE